MPFKAKQMLLYKKISTDVDVWGENSSIVPDNKPLSVLDYKVFELNEKQNCSSLPAVRKDPITQDNAWTCDSSSRLLSLEFGDTWLSRMCVLLLRLWGDVWSGLTLNQANVEVLTTRVGWFSIQNWWPFVFPPHMRHDWACAQRASRCPFVKHIAFNAVCCVFIFPSDHFCSCTRLNWILCVQLTSLKSSFLVITTIFSPGITSYFLVL